MKKIYVRIMAGNMGDGWKNKLEAANGYAKWLEGKYGYAVEVSPHSGVGGGAWDEDGNEVDIGHHWEKWCASSDAKKYSE